MSDRAGDFDAVRAALADQFDATQVAVDGSIRSKLDARVIAVPVRARVIVRDAGGGVRARAENRVSLKTDGFLLEVYAVTPEQAKHHEARFREFLAEFDGNAGT